MADGHHHGWSRLGNTIYWILEILLAIQVCLPVVELVLLGPAFYSAMEEKWIERNGWMMLFMCISKYYLYIDTVYKNKY